MNSAHIQTLPDDITVPTIWTIIESNMAIISACLIVSRPFFVKIYPEKLIGLVHAILASRRAYTDKERRWPGWTPFSHFQPLTETPPALTHVSFGRPFEVDVEKNWGPGNKDEKGRPGGMTNLVTSSPMRNPGMWTRVGGTRSLVVLGRGEK
ncbi:MAG: hypothetical protein Q9216_006068 [Gyalolechia sp. 2 TL-2023]